MSPIRVILLLGLFAGMAAWLDAAVAGDRYAPLALIRSNPPSTAPPFTVASPSGSEISLEHYRRRFVFLNFWATWCPPCRQEMPGMQRLYERFRDRGFEVVAISIDGDPDLVPPFVREHGLTFAVGLDPAMRVAGQYRVAALPSTFLVDRRGRIVARALGPREWDGPDARGLVEQLLSEP